MTTRYRTDDLTDKLLTLPGAASDDELEPRDRWLADMLAAVRNTRRANANLRAELEDWATQWS